MKEVSSTALLLKAYKFPSLWLFSVLEAFSLCTGLLKPFVAASRIYVGILQHRTPPILWLLCSLLRHFGYVRRTNYCKTLAAACFDASSFTNHRSYALECITFTILVSILRWDLEGNCERVHNTEGDSAHHVDAVYVRKTNTKMNIAEVAHHQLLSYANTLNLESVSA